MKVARHGHAKTHTTGKTKTYVAWLNMRLRCTYPKNTSYKRYGARGISFCKRWESFDNFLADMGECPPGLTLDRIDNSKGYEKSNCRWASRQVQTANRSVTRCVTIDGQTNHIKFWEEKFGLCHSTIYRRVKRGMSFEQAICSMRDERAE